MDIHFKCTQCGKCCRDTRLPLTVAEAINWLLRGHEVQLLCEASPWPEALDRDPRAAHFKRRSFPAMSGSMPVRVVVMLVANIVGKCPNLLTTMQCGIYEERPLVCRIYPAEVNPFVMLKPGSKACPPEAWNSDQPALQRAGGLVDDMIRQDIEKWRATDALEADLKRRLCIALNVVDTGLVHEAMLVHSPTSETLMSALAFAIATGSGQERAGEWRFVSDLPETVTHLAKGGGIALHLNDAGASPFQHVGFRREAIFSIDTDRQSLP